MWQHDKVALMQKSLQSVWETGLAQLQRTQICQSHCDTNVLHKASLTCSMFTSGCFSAQHVHCAHSPSFISATALHSYYSSMILNELLLLFLFCCDFFALDSVLFQLVFSAGLLISVWSEISESHHRYNFFLKTGDFESSWVLMDMYIKAS